MSDKLITHAEIVEMFGASMPWDAVAVLVDNPDNLTLPEIRVRLQEMTINRADQFAQSLPCPVCKRDGNDARKLDEMIERYGHLLQVADELSASNRRLLGMGKALLALCERVGVADNILADFFPDTKNRDGSTILDVTKEARRTMNEARAIISGEE